MIYKNENNPKGPGCAPLVIFIAALIACIYLFAYMLELGWPLLVIVAILIVLALLRS